MEDKKEKEVSKSGLNGLHVIGVILWTATIMALLLVYVFTGHFRLTEEELAVVERFGVPHTVSKSGWHWCIPFVDKISKLPKGIKGMSIGYDAETYETIQRESLMITKDMSFINVDLYVEYRVTDPIQAVIHESSYEDIIKNLAQSYIRDTVGLHDVDGVYTTEKAMIQAEAEEKLKKRVESENIGYGIERILIQDTEFPLVEISEAFKNVESAKQSVEVAITNANKDKNTRLPEMEANVDKILKEAEAYKESRISLAKGQVARFESLYSEYIKFPEVTKKRVFYETMDEILPQLKVVINTTDGDVQTILPLEKFSDINVNENNNDDNENNNNEEVEQ